MVVSVGATHERVEQAFKNLEGRQEFPGLWCGALGWGFDGKASSAVVARRDSGTPSNEVLND